MSNRTSIHFIKKMFSKAALLCLESSLFLRWELFNRNSVTNTPLERKLNSEYYKLRKRLRDNPKEFFEYFNMSVGVYDYIYEHVNNRLDANIVTIKTITPGEKLFITLRYLAKGMTLRELSLTFLIGCSTASKIINDTLAVLWEVLHPFHLSPPKPADFKRLAQDYHHRWHFPNCVGAIGGKYIALSRHKRHKTKQYWRRIFNKSSLVLHAVADSEFRFLAVDIKLVKDEPDYTFKGTFSHLGFNVPPGSETKLPLVLIGNKAFPLKKNLLRPFPPRATSICRRKANFNKRLESARITVDCAFEIMTEKWEILKRPMEVNLDFAMMTVKVACLLNNIIKDIDGMLDPHFCKFGQKDHGVIYLDLLTRHSKKNNRASSVAVQVREQFEKYLMENE